MEDKLLKVISFKGTSYKIEREGFLNLFNKIALEKKNVLFYPARLSEANCKK